MSSFFQIETKVIAPAMVTIPGGPFVMGSVAMDKQYGDATPHWVELSPYRLGATAVAESLYRDVTGQAGNENAPGTHPVVNVSREKAVQFLRRVQGMGGSKFGLPTEAEQENAIRGRAVDLRAVMRAETVDIRDFADFVRNRFENFVERVEMGTEIFTDPTGEKLRRILKGDSALYAWRVFGTDSGRAPTPEEAWFGQNGTTHADWGPANDYGLKGMVGGVWEWSADRYGKSYYRNSPQQNPMGPETGSTYSVRGGSWRNVDSDYLRAAFRNSGVSGGFNVNGGFRLAASVQDSLIVEQKASDQNPIF